MWVLGLMITNKTSDHISVRSRKLWWSNVPLLMESTIKSIEKCQLPCSYVRTSIRLQASHYRCDPAISSCSRNSLVWRVLVPFLHNCSLQNYSVLLLPPCPVGGITPPGFSFRHNEAYHFSAPTVKHVLSSSINILTCMTFFVAAKPA